MRWPERRAVDVEHPGGVLRPADPGPPGDDLAPGRAGRRRALVLAAGPQRPGDRRRGPRVRPPPRRPAVELMHGGRWVGHSLHPALSDLPIGLWSGILVLDAHRRGHRRRWAPGRGRDAERRGARGSRGDGGDRGRRLERQRRRGPSRRASSTGCSTPPAWCCRARRWPRACRAPRRRARRLARGASGSRPRRASSAATSCRAARSWSTGSRRRPGRRVGCGRSRTPTCRTPRRSGVEVEGRARAALPARRRGPRARRRVQPRGGAALPRCGGDCAIVCPLHRSAFDLRDGSIVRGPAHHPQPVLPARVRNGWVEVRGSQPRSRRKST